MARNDRIYDPYTGRSYKAGFSPAEMMRPIEGTCARCGGDLTIYPAGAVCAACSPEGAAKELNRLMERARVARGYIPLAEEC